MHFSFTSFLLSIPLLALAAAHPTLEKRAYYYTRTYLSSVAPYRSLSIVAPACYDPVKGFDCDFNCDSRDRYVPHIAFPPDASKGETEDTMVSLCMYFVLDDRCPGDGGEEANCPHSYAEIVNVVVKKTGWSKKEARRRLKEIEKLSKDDVTAPEGLQSPKPQDVPMTSVSGLQM